MRKNIVVIGGGNGSAITIEAVRACGIDMNLSAVISSLDSGGSSGILRREFDTLPAGDILRAVLAMSVYDYRTVLKPLFYSTRFEDVGKLDGHNLGNLFLVLSGNYDGKFVSGIRALEQAVRAVGHVYPATKMKSNLVVRLASGKIVKTESEIDRPNYDLRDRIVEAYMEPKVEANDHAIDMITKADYIFFGPGSLYCSIVASILPTGMREAIDQSKAKLVYVVGNAYEREGETGPTTLSGFISHLERYLPRSLDFILHNDTELQAEQRERYFEKKWGIIDSSDKINDGRVLSSSFESDIGGLCPNKLANLLIGNIF